MKQRKVVKIWQFIIVVCLYVGILATMFMPVIVISGDSLQQELGEVLPEMEEYEEYDEDDIEKVLDALGELVDDVIETHEDEYDVNIHSISPWQIMSQSFMDLTYGDKQDDEEIIELVEKDSNLSALQEKYDMLSLAFFVLYIPVLVLMFIWMIGFLIKMVKYVPLGFNMAYGSLFLGMFTYLGFFSLKVSADGLQEISDMLYLKASASEMEVLIKAIMRGLQVQKYGMVFCAVLAVFVLCNVIFVFVGKQKAATPQYDSFQQPVEHKVQNYETNRFTGTMPGENQSVASSQMFQEEMPQEQVTVAMTEEELETDDVLTEALQSEDSWIDSMQAEAPEMDASTTQNSPIETEQVKTTAMETEPVKMTQTQTEEMGYVCVSKGIAKGQGLMLPQSRKVVVGKNRKNANLVINNVHVSNVHCSIRYNAERNIFIVKDHSSNGTFINGERLQKNVPMECPVGTVLTLADGQDEIYLGKQQS